MEKWIITISFIVTGILFLSVNNFEIFAEEVIMITESPKMQTTVFDGKWTDSYEWKQTTKTDLFTEEQIYIRTAHYKDFIYVMIDHITDNSIDVHSDKVIVCFDTENKKSKKPTKNDYCFQATMGLTNGVILQGDSPSAISGYFKKIQSHKEFIAVGTKSGEDNRYSQRPHVIYEMKIPIEVIGRSDNYGFLVYVYDHNTNSVMTWPKDIVLNDRKNIPAPSEWGNLISPDKSLPEFNVPILLSVLALIPTLIIGRFSRFLSY
jgi:hypothetical protein